MINFFLQRLTAFKNAFSGCWYVIRTQKNSWLHLLASILSFALACWLQLSAINWAVLVLTITLVWAAETFNTSIEVLVDLASPEKHPQAKIIKDVSAAGVLITAFSSIIIGIILFGPPLWMRISLILHLGG